ncbi:MerR family transcriptional regulator [Pseudogemmobacter bohemicus]|nr:MerR family transcriptional regulator [Pseudogemmobacter bohemicus]
MDKSPDAFRTISEVAEALETPAHVLRFWETRFPQIRPVKRAGGRRYYRPSDLALLAGIRRLLHEEGMTIRGVQKILREQGVRHVAGLTDEASAEEEALISAMSTKTTPRSAEVTRLTPREADQASIDALEAEARSAALPDAGSSEADDPGSDSSATVIAFPVETPKEPALPAFDPRQIMFPGFEADAGPVDELSVDELIAPVEEEARQKDPAQAESPSQAKDAARSEDVAHEEAPFAFDIGPEDDLGLDPDTGDEAGRSDSIAPFPVQEDQPRARAAAGADQPVDEAPPTPDVHTPASHTAAHHTLAARLRALPPGRLNPRNETLRSLSRRLVALRQRLSEAQKHGG